METQKFKILIPQELYLDRSNFSSHAIPVYCVLKAISNKYFPIQEITCSQIAYLLYKTKKHSRATLYNISLGLNQLSEADYINTDNVSTKSQIVNFTPLWGKPTKDEFFSTVYFDEIEKIMQIGKNDTSSLLRYFVLLVSTFKSIPTNNPEISTYRPKIFSELSLNYLADVSGLHKSTITSYNNILINLGLLHVYNIMKTSINTTNGKYNCNIYCRAQDKQIVGDYVFKNNPTNDSVVSVVDRNILNCNRSLSQKYNALCAGKVYTAEEVKQIYTYVMESNEKNRQLFDETQQLVYYNRIRPTAVFERFDYLKNYDWQSTAEDVWGAAEPI